MQSWSQEIISIRRAPSHTTIRTARDLSLAMVRTGREAMQPIVLSVTLVCELIAGMKERQCKLL